MDDSGFGRKRDGGEEMLAVQKKILLHERLRTVLIILLAVPVLAFGIQAVLSVRRMETQLDTVTGEVGGISGKVEALSGEVERMAGQLTTLNTLSSKLIGEVEPGELLEVLDSLKAALSSVSDAAKTLAGVDTDAVNSLLTRLDDELDGISDALDTVKQLDPAAINNLLNRLDEVMATVDRLSGILDKLSGFKLFG